MIIVVVTVTDSPSAFFSSKAPSLVPGKPLMATGADSKSVMIACPAATTDQQISSSGNVLAHCSSWIAVIWGRWRVREREERRVLHSVSTSAEGDQLKE